MPNINEVRDGGPHPAPSVAEMKESARKGHQGIGLSDETFLERLGDHAASINGEEDNKDTPSEGASLPFTY
ncbi:MAG: hypothetical protein ACYDDS_19785 [Candidatus Sulfotelmatobacter sp.]